MWLYHYGMLFFKSCGYIPRSVITGPDMFLVTIIEVRIYGPMLCYTEWPTDSSENLTVKNIT